MKIVLIKMVVSAVLVFTAVAGFAQYTYYKPMEGFGIEISLSNTTLKRMPMYRNAIASLAVVGDNIIGGTSANENLSPFILLLLSAKGN